MKNSSNLSSRELTTNNEDRIINRDLIDPNKNEKRLLRVYDYEINKSKHNLNLNSIAVDNSSSMKLPKNSIEGKEEILKSNYGKEAYTKQIEKSNNDNLNTKNGDINFPRNLNSGFQNFNRIKVYKESENNYDANFNTAGNQNYNNSVNNKKNEEFKNRANKQNDYNYRNHLKVFNSLSNFSDSNDKTFNLNDSKLTFNSRIENSQNLNKNNFLTNLNNSNSNLNANLHTYDENLNKYKRNYLNTTDSRESSVNKNSNERKYYHQTNKTLNSNLNNKNNFGIEKNNYIKINESTEIPVLGKREENNFINNRVNINYKEIPLSSNLMGIETTKLQKTIENDMKEYNSMSKIMKEQIGNYNSKLNQMSKNIGILTTSSGRNNLPINENLLRKDFNEDNKHEINNNNLRLNKFENIKNSSEELITDYSNNYKNNLSERNSKNKNDLNKNNNKSNLSSIEKLNNNRNHSNDYNYLNRVVAQQGAYEKYNFEAYKNQNNYKYSALSDINKKNNDGLNYDYSNNSNKNTINNLQNTNPDIPYEDPRSHKIEDLEKNIFHLKNRIESNLKNRENMVEKFKEENSNFLINNSNNDYNQTSKIRPELHLLNKTIESNTIKTETEKSQNNINSTEQQMNLLNNSTEENFNKNNVISNYLEKYKENLNREKLKNDPKSVLDNKQIWEHQQQLKIEKLKIKPFEALKTEESLENQKNERRKVLDMIKDCKKEIEFYKQKISLENQDLHCFPDLGISDNLPLDVNNNKINNRRNNIEHINKNPNSNYEVKSSEGHHKTNFTLGREQDFNTNNNYNGNFNSNQKFNTFKRPNSKSADRYIDSKIQDLSINETYLTNKNKNQNNNDYSSNINLTIDSASNKSAHGNIYDSKLNNNKNLDYKTNARNQNSTEKRTISKGKVINNYKNDNKLNKPSSIKNSICDKSPIKILTTNANSINTKTPLREKTNTSTSKNKIITVKKNEQNKNKSLGMPNSKKAIPSVTNFKNNTNTRNKSFTKPKNLNYDNSKNNNNKNVNNTYLSTIPNTKKTAIWDKLSNLDDISSLDENLEQVQKQKREILKEENEILKEKIKHLETKIDNLEKINENLIVNKRENFMNKNYSEDANKENNLIMELQIWKNRSQKMTENYISTLNDLRNQLKQDKKHYVDLIKNMQSEFHSEVDRLKKAYEGNIVRNEKVVKKLKKENEEISKKLGKVKDIIALSGQNQSKKK
jgi:hypothetical protein